MIYTDFISMKESNRKRARGVRKMRGNERRRGKGRDRGGLKRRKRGRKGVRAFSTNNHKKHFSSIYSNILMKYLIKEYLHATSYELGSVFLNFTDILKLSGMALQIIFILSENSK